MGFWSDLGSGLVDLVTDVVPGGNLIEAGVKAVGGLFTGGGGGGGGAMPVIDVPAYELGGSGLAGYSSGGTSGIVPVSTGGLPALATAQTAATAAAQSPGGILPWWRGPGGKLQMPWNDPRVPEFLKQFSLDDSYLRTAVRAPRGFVVIRDGSGRPFAVQRDIAIKLGVWKPSPKPLLTSTDVKALRRADRLEKKIKTISKRYGEKVKTVYRDKKKKR